MKINFAQIDLVQTRATWPVEVPFAPAYLRKFKLGEPAAWAVVDAPIVPGQPLSWAHTDHDEYLRIPVFPYMLQRATDHALATMFLFGLECAGQFPRPAQELLIITGVPVALRYEADQQTYAGLEYYFGFAIR